MAKHSGYQQQGRPAQVRRPACIIGCDPGISGAVAVYDPAGHRLVEVWDLPTITTIKGRYRTNHIDVHKLAFDLAAAVKSYGVTDIALEQVHSSPQMGVVSAFSFGQTFGRIETICAFTGTALHRVSPAVWKRRMGIKGDKKNSVEAARRMFGADPWFKRVSYDGRAEAALLAVYAAQDLMAEVDPLS